MFLNRKGTLVIDGGKFIAGRKSKTWCFNVHRGYMMKEGLSTIYYDGWAYNLSSGNAVRHYEGITVINDGTFHSYGGSTIKTVQDANLAGKVIINGGDYRLMGATWIQRYVIDAAYSKGGMAFHINGGNFSTEKMIVRQGVHGSYEWNVDLYETEIVWGIPYITFNEDAKFKYDGKGRDLTWIKQNLPKSSKKFEVIPGLPKISFSPEVEDDYYQISNTVKNYKITALVEPYLEDIGLNRKTKLKYSIYNLDEGKNIFDTTELMVDTTKKGLTTYIFNANEYDANNEIIGASSAYFDVRVSEEPAPKITITAEGNPVNSGDQVKLVAYSDKVDNLMLNYEWSYYDGAEIAKSEKFQPNGIKFPAPSKNGEYLIQCVGTDMYYNTGIDIFLLQVGGEGARPRISTEELIFKQGKSSNGIYAENIGGPVDNENWSCVGELPPGLEFVKNLGLPGFRGKPTQAGKWSVTIKANVVGGYAKTINIIVTAPIEITTNTKLPDGVKGEEYEGKKLNISGGGDVKWTVVEGALPVGLNLNINTGEIEGTPKPDYSGEFKFTVQAEVTGEIPATKEFSLYIHAKPKFKDSEIKLTAPHGKETPFPNQLKEGTGTIQYWLLDAPAGVSLTSSNDPRGSGRIVVGKDVAANDHEFTINAKGYNDSTASATVRLKVTKAPVLTDGMFVYLPYGEVNKEYNCEDMLKGSIYSDKAGTWSTDGTLPAGLTLNGNGTITGKPTTDTGLGTNGYPDFESLTFKFTDEDGLSETVYAFFYIVEENGNKKTTTISFDKENPNDTTATMYTNMVNQLFVYIDGVPRPKYEIIGLPEWIIHSAADGKGNITLQSTFPPQTGTFNFTVKAKNDLNSDWVTQDLTIQVKNPVKADSPSANKPSGTYKKNELETIKLTHGYTDKTVKIFCSTNGGEFKGIHVIAPGTIDIPITDDTTIRTYADTLFGLGGVAKSNSDIATYKYILIEDDDPVFVSIENNLLPDGEINKDYTDVKLKGTATNSKPLNWTASGLPKGLIVNGDKIMGKPEVSGDFTVKLMATTADKKATANKSLQLYIADKSLPTAAEPLISVHPQDKTYKMDDEAVALTVTATGSGTLSYQWYESEDNSNSTKSDDILVNIGKENSYTPPTDTAGTKHYYVIVTNNLTNYQPGRITSNVAKIDVVFDAATPYFDDTEVREYLFTQGTKQTIMEIALADDDGVLSYEWYKMKGTEPKPESDKKVKPGPEYKDTDGILNIIAPTIIGAEDKYYAMVTNTNEAANGANTAGPVRSPISIVKATDKVRYKITLDSQYGEEKFEVTTDFDGKLGGLPLLERSGYRFDGWYDAASGGNKITEDKVFTADTTIYAHWTKTTSSSGGSGGGGGGGGGGTVAPVTPKPEVPKEEDPKEETKPTEKPVDTKIPFTDTKISDWFHGNVKYVYEKGLMNGTGATTFGPIDATTRSMIVTILHRLEATPKAAAINPFIDVLAGKWYTDGVVWVAEKNIVKGYGDNKFGPEDAITREQMAVILMNYASFKGYDVKAKADLSKFDDGASVSSWAKDAISWANAKGLIQGSDNKLMPTGKATRAQIAAILERFITSYDK